MSITLPLDNPPPRIVFTDKKFYHTGKTVTGPMGEFEAEVQSRGGIVCRKVTSDLDYLVVGAIDDSEKISVIYRRAIEKAVGFRDAGHPIAIVTEQHWAQFL